MAAQDHEVDFDLAHYLGVLSRRRWIVLSITAIVFGAALGYAMCWPPVYRATTVLNIEREGGNAAAGQGIAEIQDEEYFGTQFKLITSETALRRSGLLKIIQPTGPSVSTIMRSVGDFIFRSPSS